MAAMAGCPVCHADNPDGARYCANCGSALGPLQAREVRKTIYLPGRLLNLVVR